MRTERDFQPFDWALYGMLLRKKRLDLGFRKAEEFAASIWRRTRVRISRDTLYKIEQGKQIPDAEQFMAINLALSQVLFDTQTADLCLSPEWRGIVGSCIPETWKEENAEAAWQQKTGVGDLSAFHSELSDGELLALYDASASEIASDDAELFSAATDDKWHSAIHGHIEAIHGPDTETWPRAED